MPKITVLPHEDLCPEGQVIDAKKGDSVCDALLANHIDIEHACDQVCACTTCHVIFKQGLDTIEPSDENEDDMLDKAWGLTPESRLSCQSIMEEEDITIVIGIKQSFELVKTDAESIKKSLDVVETIMKRDML